MGKKKGASTSDADKVSRDWSASAISSRDINKLRNLGFISASEEDIRLPAHEFLRSLLFFYRIQLWQLTPNSILHLSIFITVCEAFLGIDPHWGLWRKIFYVKRHNDSNGPPVVGGVGFVVRQDVDYLDYPMKESVQGWRNKWFYLRDPAVSGSPPLLNVILLYSKAVWSQRMIMTTPRRLKMRSIPLKTVMSERKKLRRTMLSSGAGEESSSDDDDEVPLAKRAKSSLGRKASAQDPKPSPAKSTPPSRTAMEKIPVSRLRKTVKSSADQVLEANRLASDAKKENALLKEEMSKLKQQMKDEQDARRAAAVAIDKKEGVLRESVKDLLEAANIIVTRRHQLREDSTADALSLAAESNVQVLGLLQKTKGALSRLYLMIFPKAKQDKTLSELADAFLVDPSEPVEVLKRRNRLFGAVLTFQLLMGHVMGSELEKLSKALHVDDDNHLIDLEPFKRSAVTCASQLLKLVDEVQAKPTPESAPGSSAANP
ncbi:hypothetical protein QYE76_051007 [Lolium multiflorum]|uniref:Transposase (putative) gypsy type domain-containing protein n=1 Tax=Lolium multiflorum TaxID=4521 RepID=A0AAD8SR26_LOLMU|nr:hypothetical protein QYE76_051007 [Lolium multiflorum]